MECTARASPADESVRLLARVAVDYCTCRGCSIPTIASQLAAVNAGGTTTVAQGVSVSGANSTGIAAALAMVEAADVVVLAIGYDHTMEHEGMDAAGISLPGLQESFALQVLAKKKPTVLVLMGNDCNGIDKLIGDSAAIVRAWYPATHGARALATLLFGKANRWGCAATALPPLSPRTLTLQRSRWRCASLPAESCRSRCTPAATSPSCHRWARTPAPPTPCRTVLAARVRTLADRTRCRILRLNERFERSY